MSTGNGTDKESPCSIPIFRYAPIIISLLKGNIHSVSSKECARISCQASKKSGCESFPRHPSTLLPGSIQTKENKQKDRKSPQRGSTITKERERDSYDRCQSRYHSHVYHQMEKEYRGNTISIHPPKGVILSFRQNNQSKNKRTE